MYTVKVTMVTKASLTGPASNLMTSYYVLIEFLMGKCLMLLKNETQKYSFVETKLHRMFKDFCSEQAACYYEMNFSLICYDCNIRSIEKTSRTKCIY